MNKLLIKYCILASTFCIFSSSHAIAVKVQSSSKNITALGFKVNGKQHGGLGSTYEAKSLPKGKYSFGLRENGKDIPCKTDKGQKSVKLTKSTRATLLYKNGKCVVKLK